MSSYVEFLNELDRRVGERVEELTGHLVAGAAVQTIEVYREKVGELRGLKSVAEMIRAATSHVNQRTKD